MAFDALVAVSLGYVALLFLVAFAAERRAAAGRTDWVRSPVVYTLSLSIYCTAWTFYGAVGYAVRSGLEYLVIYLGPTLVLIGWWGLVRIGRTQRLTSIADLISARYGKSNRLGVLVTLLAVGGTTPYIALQLQSVTLSFAVFADQSAGGHARPDPAITALGVAAGLAFFTVLFGTRNLDANDRHHGVVMAIAVEAVVKLAALMAVGVFVVWGVAGGPAAMLARIDASPLAAWDLAPGRWAGLIFLSAAAVLCLPRMFQVMVVENADERHLATASWAFPLYMALMSLFVMPIAVVGLAEMPAGSNPDLFVLTLPLALGREELATLAFLGGFSSATSMVIVAALALATMVSNQVVLPLWVGATRAGATLSGDVRTVVLRARRLSIALVLALGYGYYRLSGGGAALAAIGLVSFTGVAQVLPALLGGVYWRGATRDGAAAGLIVGFAVWLYTLFLPSVGAGALMSGAVMADGPWGLDWLRPQALFGLAGLDPVPHALFWSMTLNAAAFLGVSLAGFPSALERLQGAQVVDVFAHSTPARGWPSATAEAEDLLVMAQRILGPETAQTLFRRAARAQGTSGYLPEITPDFLERLERELTGSVGAATAHAMVGQIVGGASVSVADLMAVADETAQIMEHSSQIEAKSAELAHTAAQLREANAKLTEISGQKDAFLGAISHELRTPMTSIRAFSEILMQGAELDAEERHRAARVIQDEAIRLTRLLDDLLDLNVLESGGVRLARQTGELRDMLDRAVTAANAEAPNAALRILRNPAAETAMLFTDTDRLAQVFINLISNARKYCDAAEPALAITMRRRADAVAVDFVDNGSGVPPHAQRLVFEKFSRAAPGAGSGGAGLGLAICREVMDRLGGRIEYLPGQAGGAFRVTLPEAATTAA